MTTPTIENKMSIGNLLNLLALVVAVAVGWGVMRERCEKATRALRGWEKFFTRSRRYLMLDAADKMGGQSDLA